MNAKKIFILTLLALVTTALYAQKGKSEIRFNNEELPAQVLEYMNRSGDDSRKKENTKAVRIFESDFAQMDVPVKDRLVVIYETAVKLRMRAYPDMYNMVTTMHLYYAEGQNFDAWVSSIELLQSRNKKVKDVTDFVNFSQQLIADRTLYKSPSSMWQAQPGTPYRLKVEDKEILVDLQGPFELYYSSGRDNGTIYGTSGLYSYFDNKWQGKGGRLNWDRTGLPTTTCWAVLDKYEAVLRFPKFTADSVSFTHTTYFQQPILGRVEEALSAKVDPDRYQFPKFRSYQTDFFMKDILEGVDYQGSFMMRGSKFVTSDPQNPATLLFYRNGEKFIAVRSPKFTITSSRFSTEKASVKIYVGDDSICNNGITVRYSVADKAVILINDDKRNFYSPYSNSYHNLDMYCEQIVWKKDGDIVDFSMLVEPGARSFATFESRNYYSAAKYRQIQGIDEVSPSQRVFRYMQSRGGIYEFYVDEFAAHIHMDISQAKLMIHNLAKSGLVLFDETDGMVYVQDKLLDYERARAKSAKSDYDAITLSSEASGRNARLDLNSKDLHIAGVSKFIVSDSQRVAIFPRNGDITVKKNREIAFSGRVNVGRFVMYVTDADFSYEKFSLDLPKIDSLYFAVTDFLDPTKDHIVYTPLFNLVGNIQIDSPDNRTGLKRNKEAGYPIFNSLQDSYVYYDRADIYNGTYKRDKFYYTLKPFTIKRLMDFKTDSLMFNGSLTSAGIFPEIVEPLKVQRDYSLGFTIQTPEGGYEAYGGKGHYTSTISLSYQGLRGDGRVDYLSSTINSKNIVFMPDSMIAVSDNYTLREEGNFPDVRIGHAKQNWYPYADSMLVSQLPKGKPFKMYHDNAELHGQLIVKPSGAFGRGKIVIQEGTLESDRFELLPLETNAQVASFTLYSEVHDNLAFSATNLKAHVDYETRRAEFTANAAMERTQLPVVQYVAYIDKVAWEIDKKELDLLNSKSESTMGLEGLALRERMERPERPGARYVSTDPKQDSLQFFAVHGIYRYNDGDLACRDVFSINIADAAVAPRGDTLRVRAGGKMNLLQKSQILASRDNRNHLIYDADIVVNGAKSYSGKGYIDYIDENEKSQKIFLSEIEPNSAGVTVGNGFISDSANFTLNSAFGFAGKVRVEADKEFYHFDGGVRLLHNCVAGTELGLLAYADYLDPKNIRIMVPELPTDWKGQPITASILFNKSTMSPYPAFLTADRPADNQLLSSFGMLTYDNSQQRYIIASEHKLNDFDNVVGRNLILNTRSCTVEGEGPISFGAKNGVTSMFIHGTAKVDPKDVNACHLNTVFGFTFPMDAGVLDAMARNIADDLRLSPSNPDNEVLRRTMIYYMGELAGNEAYSSYVATNQYDKKPEQFESSILFEDLQWKYSPALGYYTNGVAALASVGKNQIHLNVRVKAQVYKRGTETYLTLYIQAASDHWYYFNFEFTTQRMTVYSSVGEFVDMIKQIPQEKRMVSGKGGVGTFSYRVGSSRSEVQNFLLKMEGGTPLDDEYDEYDEEDSEE